MLKRKGLSLLLASCLLFPVGLFAGDYDEKILKHQEMFRQDSTNLDAAYQLGNYLAWDSRYAEALTIFGEILEMDPDNEDAEIGIARVYAWKGDQAVAINKYEEILQRHPGNFEAYQGLGNLALWTNDFEKSIGFFEKALKMSPEDIVSLKGIGRAYLGRGDRRRAEEFFTQAEILEIKETPLQFLVGILAGSFLLLLFLFLLIRSRIVKRKKILLRMDLKVLRYAFALYHYKTGKFPLALEELLEERWRPPGATEEQPLLEGVRRGDRGFLVDPFGKKYWYNPDTGGIRSTMKGCEKW